MNKLIFGALIASALFAACKTSQKSRTSGDKIGMEKSQNAGTIGKKTGEKTGTDLGNRGENTVLGAIMNAAIGGPGGVLIGQKMDKQAKEMEVYLGKTAAVERVGEGIKVTFNTQLLFAFGLTEVNEMNRADLKKLAQTLQFYPETDLLVVGHTDDSGADAGNQTLSEKRADAVAQCLITGGVKYERLKIQGWGETQPAVLNDSEAGRAQNRRVEIAIYANNQLKMDSKKEAGQ